MSRGFVVSLLVVAAAACDPDAPGPLEPPPVESRGYAASYGAWTPTVHDTCPAAVHDGWSVVGPDGLVYPTWHPPVDPVTGCTFGHEHGRDPSGSDLFDLVGPIPFGLANQHLDESGFGAERREDHVGHKIEWENDMPMSVGDGGSAVFDVRCDVLVKLHQGTHSPDAFTNNLHEVAYHVRCTDGTGFSATLLTPIGRGGEIEASCQRERRHRPGTPVPANSPDGGGRRILPDAQCVRDEVLRPEGERSRFHALNESWEISASLRAESGRVLASFNPYFQVRDPSRFFDPAAERGIGRPVALCFGEGLRARGGPCEEVASAAAPVPWDDPRSPFKGAHRVVDINGNRVKNADGPEVWYTDPLGHRGSPLPFPGSIRQWVARHDNQALDLHGPVIGRDYDAPGVHAPN